MTTPKLAKRKTLEAQAPKVIEMILDGATEQGIADTLGCSKRGVQLFKARHESLLSKVREEAAEKVKTEWITDRVARIAKIQRLFELAEAEVNDYGLTVVETRTEHDNGKETVYETRDFRGQLVKEMRGLLRDAATELGQIIPPKGDQPTSGHTFIFQITPPAQAPVNVIEGVAREVPQLG